MEPAMADTHSKSRRCMSLSKLYSNASWLYPFKGIYYFATHPFLYPLLKARLLPCFLLSIFVLVNLFFWTYLPQVAFLLIFHGPLAWIQAALLVLGEGATVIALLFEAFFVDETLVDVFDAVLLNEGMGDLVAQGRTLLPDGSTPVRQLGRPTSSAVYSPFDFRQIAEFICFLPLNLIPLVGIPAFLVITGHRAGPLHHWRYFKLLRFSKKERKAAVDSMRLKYTWFGTIALTLQLVPVLSMLFLFTTATGSALWVAKLGKRRMAADNQAEAEPDYADDPV